MKTKKATKPNVNLNLNVRGLPQSATLAINELSAKLRHEGKHVYRLGLGQSPFPVPRSVIEELKVKVLNREKLAREKCVLIKKVIVKMRKEAA